MTFVTITDHNTLEGALRIAHEQDTFLSVEVTTRFPEDDVTLHVLVWGLTEQDHRDLQPFRPSVYELVVLPARAGASPRARTPALPDGPAADGRARRADDAAVRRVGGTQRRAAAGVERARLQARRCGDARVPRDTRRSPRDRAGARGPDRADGRLRRPRRTRHRHDVDGRPRRHGSRAPRLGRARGELVRRWARLHAEACACGCGAVRPCVPRVRRRAAGHDPRAGRGALRSRRGRRRGAPPGDRRRQRAARAPARGAGPLRRHRAHLSPRCRPPPRRARVRRRPSAPVPRHRAPSRRLARRPRRDRARLLRPLACDPRAARARLHGHLRRGEWRRRDDAADRGGRRRGAVPRRGRRRLARPALARCRAAAAGLVAAVADVRVARPPLPAAHRRARPRRGAAAGRDPRRDSRPGRPLRPHRRAAARNPCRRLVPHRARAVRAPPDARPARCRGDRRLCRLVLQPVRDRARADAAGPRGARWRAVSPRSASGAAASTASSSGRSAGTTPSAHGCWTAPRCSCSRSAASRTRSGSASSSTRTPDSPAHAGTCAWSSWETGPPGASSNGLHPTGRCSSARRVASSSLHCSRAPTSSASPARRTRSARCSSRRARRACLWSPPLPAARSSSWPTGRPGCSSHPTTPARSHRRCSTSPAIPCGGRRTATPGGRPHSSGRGTPPSPSWRAIYGRLAGHRARGRARGRRGGVTRM